MSTSVPDNDAKITDSVWERPPIDPAATAVVVVDMVNWQIPRVPNSSGLGPAYYVDRLAGTVIPNHVRLLDGCRAAGLPVIFLRVGCYQPDYSDAIAPFRVAIEEYDARDGTEACAVIAELAPKEGDLTLLKTGSGGFTTSGLDSHLRNMGIKHVIYTGVVTNGCVLLTLAAGFDLGYFGYLVSDATATFTPELQDQAENIIGQYLAEVRTTDDMLAALPTPMLVGVGSPV
jgi:nicotinamidase-related amidase